MRRFFLGDTELAACGLGNGAGGWKCFCQTCGTIWGTVSGVEKAGWFSVSIPCEKHGTAFTCGGSFLKPLKWWDRFNGTSLEAQLSNADESLLRHEGLIAALWIKEHKA
jgi:hypothetical protein